MGHQSVVRRTTHKEADKYECLGRESNSRRSANVTSQTSSTVQKQSIWNDCMHRFPYLDQKNFLPCAMKWKRNYLFFTFCSSSFPLQLFLPWHISHILHAHCHILMFHSACHSPLARTLELPEQMLPHLVQEFWDASFALFKSMIIESVFAHSLSLLLSLVFPLVSKDVVGFHLRDIKLWDGWLASIVTRSLNPGAEHGDTRK